MRTRTSRTVLSEVLMRTPHRWVRPKQLQPSGFIRPALPVLVHKVPAGDGWLHELKHDGFRIVALKDGDTVRLWSRNGRNWRADFLAITAAVMALPVTTIALDGEAVAHCPEGLPDFHALLGREGCTRACLYAFDLLLVGAKDLRGLTLVERRALLREHLKSAGPAIIYSEHLAGADGEGMFRHACRLGLEGIVSKRAASRYRSGRCASWVKVKNPPMSGDRSEFGTILKESYMTQDEQLPLASGQTGGLPGNVSVSPNSTLPFRVST